VSAAEFYKALRELKLAVLTQEEVALLFSYLDHDGAPQRARRGGGGDSPSDAAALPSRRAHWCIRVLSRAGSGSISYDELLVGIRGELSPQRKELVDLAFKVREGPLSRVALTCLPPPLIPAPARRLQKLDKTGDGVADMDDLIAAYDTAQHPGEQRDAELLTLHARCLPHSVAEVRAGRMKSADALRAFLDGFDGGERDGKVTPLEFQRYYATLSASIDDDDYFELMMRCGAGPQGGVACLRWLCIASLPPPCPTRAATAGTSAVARGGRRTRPTAACWPRCAMAARRCGRQRHCGWCGVWSPCAPPVAPRAGAGGARRHHRGS
jgi:hypothetical protein